MTRPSWCALLLLVGLEAHAQELVGASLSRVDVHGDNQNDDASDDDFLLLQERADLSLAAGELRLNLRLDGDLFAAEPDPSYRSGASLERMSLSWERADLTLTAGDFTTQLGHGIALSLRKLPEVGADNALRGGRLDWQGELVAVTALLGLVNTGNVDPISLRHVDDPEDFVAGAQAQLVAADRVSVGVLGSLLMPRERLLPDAADWTLTSGALVGLDDVLGVLRIRAEVDVQQRTLAGVQRQGAAAFLDANLRLGDATLLLEALWLADLEVKGSRNSATGARFDYNQPPTLERFDQEVQNNRDVLGGRARIDVPVSRDASLFASHMVRVGEVRSPSSVVQTHGFLGVELDHEGARGAFTVGARIERLGLEKLAMLRDMAHLDSDALVPLGHGFDVHSFTTLQLWRTTDRPFMRGSTALSFDKGGTGSVGVELGLDTQDPSARVRHLFLAANAAYQVTPEITVRATGGSQRGGIRCVGGVCRQLPAFSGARGEVEVRF